MRIILTLEVGLDEYNARMVNMSVTPTQVEYPDIMVVENESQIVEDDCAMKEVETEPKATPSSVKEVCTVKGY